MEKSVFIIPYFGSFKNYFQLFLNSCANREFFDFIIFTDNKDSYLYPENVMVHHMSFGELVELVKNKLGVDVALTRPYKLCDLRPMYGYIFSDYIKGYSYWGYCDSDLIWGDLDGILYPLTKEGYDKIFFLGHCSLIKNSQEYLEIFRVPLNNKERYKEILLSHKNHSFDEEWKDSINTIFLEQGKKIFTSELEANIYMKSSNFYLTKYNDKKARYLIDKTKRLFTYENGHIFSYLLDINNQLVKDEFLYIHMQSRDMNVRIDYNSYKYKLIPNAFEKLEYDEISSDNFRRIKLKNMNLHYFRLRSQNLFTKIRRIIRK